jgi:hypothetical protein
MAKSSPIDQPSWVRATCLARGRPSETRLGLPMSTRSRRSRRLWSVDRIWKRSWGRTPGSGPCSKRWLGGELPREYTTPYPEINMFGNEPAFGYFIRHADGISFTGSTSTVSPNDVRKAIEARDVTGLTIQ